MTWSVSWRVFQRRSRAARSSAFRAIEASGRAPGKGSPEGGGAAAGAAGFFFAGAVAAAASSAATTGTAATSAPACLRKRRRPAAADSRSSGADMSADLRRKEEGKRWPPCHEDAGNATSPRVGYPAAEAGHPPVLPPCRSISRSPPVSETIAMSETAQPVSSDPPPPVTPTRRPTVPAMEEMIGVTIPCLDHGFVRLVDYMGDDQAVVLAARVSYGTGTKRVREDRGLIRYLLRHRHTTPFEMCEIKVHMKLPIFVARQLVRSRTANLNESSGRYSVIDKEYYLPSPDVLGVQSKSNRQGRGEPVSPERAQEILEALRTDAERAYALYEELLGGTEAAARTGEQQEAAGEAPQGIARELARINLPVSFYTQWYWKIDLHNLLRFISLRADAHAQHEIQVYAQALAELTRRWVPDVYEAFVDYQMEGANLSRMEVAALRALLAGATPDLAALGMSAREQVEFRERFHLK